MAFRTKLFDALDVCYDVLVIPNNDNDLMIRTLGCDTEYSHERVLALENGQVLSFGDHDILVDDDGIALCTNTDNEVVRLIFARPLRLEDMTKEGREAF